MLIDVTVQMNGVDYRASGTPVHLPPEVAAIRYNPADGTRAQEVFGSRPKLSDLLRRAGYNVRWEDDNTQRAYGARTSPAKAEAARVNGARSAGRPRSEVRLVPNPSPAFTALARLDKGELMDLAYMLATLGKRIDDWDTTLHAFRLKRAAARK